MTANPTATPKDWAMIALLAFIWGGSFLFGRILMLEWPPFTVVFLRVALATATLWIFLAVTGKRFPLDRSLVGAIFLMGIINNVIPFSLILIGQQEIGSGLASVVNAMTPIWTLIIANRFTNDEKFTSNKILGIALGFIGVGVLIGGDVLQGLTASAWAQVAILGATISYGFAGVFGKRFKAQDPIVISTGQLTASSLVIFPIMLTTEGFFNVSAPNMELVISTLGLAILCTSYAYVLYFKILANAGATNVSLVTFLVPVSAILLGVFWLGEALTTGNLIGMTLIVMGLICVDGRLIKRLRK